MYHAAIDVIRTIAATEKIVMKSEFAKALEKSDWVNPLIKFCNPAKDSPDGIEKGSSEI